MIKPLHLFAGISVLVILSIFTFNSPEILGQVRVFTVPQGGTGNASFTDNGVIYGNASGALSVTAACSNGQVIKYSGGVPACGTDSTGGGGGGSEINWTYQPNGVVDDGFIFVSTSTNQILMGDTSTTSRATLEIQQIFSGGGSLFVDASTTLQNFTFRNATGTQATTTNFFSTALTATNAFFTGLTIGGDTFDELVGDGLDISSGDLIFDCSDVAGTGITCSGEDITAEVITAGDGLTKTVLDIDCDTASGSVFGCLSSTDWTTFNDKQAALGFTPANQGTTITIAGTANQITSSAGAQDLSANRTWTLSIPTDFRVSSTTIANLLVTGGTLLQASTGTSATTTNFFSTTASSTNLFSTTGRFSGLTVNGTATFSALADGCANLTSGVLGSTGSACGSGGGLSSYDAWTHPSAGTSATTSNIQITGSTTLQNFTFVNATGSSATTTNFFSGTASSTNLFAITGRLSTLTINSLADGCLNASSGVVGSTGSACGAGGGYTTIDDEDTPLTQRSTLNFEGAGVDCVDDTDQTTCTISGGGAGTSAYEIATTTDIAVPGVAYFTQTAGRTTLGSVATGTVSATSPITVTAGRYVLGGAATIACATCVSTSGLPDQGILYNAAGTGFATSNFLFDYTNAILKVNGGASTTRLSVFNEAKFGATATSTFNSVGDLLVVGSTTLQNFTGRNSTTTNSTSTAFSSGVLTVTGSGTSTDLQGNVRIGGNLTVEGDFEVEGALWPLLVAAIVSVIASAVMTMTNKTLTAPTINGATMTGNFNYAAVPTSDHTANGVTISAFNLGATIALMDLVYLGSSSKWLLTDADAIATTEGLLGICLDGGADTDTTTVCLKGLVRDDTWNWTPGVPLYVDTATPGQLTATRPTGADDVIRKVGSAVTADVIWFTPSQDSATDVGA